MDCNGGSECCFTPSNIFSAISWREQVIFQWDDGEICFVLDQHIYWIFFIVLAHWHNSHRVDMSPHSDTWSWFRAIQHLLSLQCRVLSGEAANANLKVLGVIPRYTTLDLIWFDIWYLTPLSAIFQLYHGDHF